jgi:hypothetical protein
MSRAEALRLPLLGAGLALYWLTAVLVGLRAEGLELGARELLNVLVLGSLGVVAGYEVARRVAGLALGAWTLLVWSAVPLLAPLYTLDSYDATMRDEVLPLLVGLTDDLRYAEGVALTVALALLLRRRRPALAAAAAILAVLLVVWLSRLPLPDLSADAFKASMAGLREYFWSARLLQWIPFAGAIAVARRSPTAAVALATWVGGYVALEAAQPGLGFEEGEFFRELLPVVPAYLLLVAAVPLLVPTLAARLGPLARPAES